MGQIMAHDMELYSCSKQAFEVSPGMSKLLTGLQPALHLPPSMLAEVGLYLERAVLWQSTLHRGPLVAVVAEAAFASTQVRYLQEWGTRIAWFNAMSHCSYALPERTGVQ